MTATALPPSDSSPSWWQLDAPSPGYAACDNDATVDLCVIGAGIAGISTAYHLAVAGFDGSIAVLDAREVAAGASGRNGGFLLAGMANRFAELCDVVGMERARELYLLTCAARDRLIETAAAEGIDECARVTGSLRLAVDESEVADLAREYDAMTAAGLGDLIEHVAAPSLPRSIAASFLAGLSFANDGASRPAGWVRGLAAAAVRRGVTIYEHSPVAKIGDGEVVLVNGSKIRASAIVVCTEPHIPVLLSEFSARILPYRSQLLATEPLDNRTALPCPMWSRRGWDYAQQLPDGRVIIGGEEHEEVSRYRALDEAVDEGDQAWLESWVERVVGDRAPVAQRWAGTLTTSSDNFPYVGAVPAHDGVYVCGGWGGAGNVLGFLGGSLIADLLHGNDRIPPEFSPNRIL